MTTSELTPPRPTISLARASTVPIETAEHWMGQLAAAGFNILDVTNLPLDGARSQIEASLGGLVVVNQALDVHPDSLKSLVNANVGYKIRAAQSFGFNVYTTGPVREGDPETLRLSAALGDVATLLAQVQSIEEI